jgi:hypothetical protein
MSNNLTPESKKLTIKSELLRHLTTATEMREQSKPSSLIKALFIAGDIDNFEHRGIEPNLKFLQEWLEK